MKTLTIITMFLAMLAKDPTPAIQQFVSTYFPKATILFTQRDEGEYEVRLSDGTETSIASTLTSTPACLPTSSLSRLPTT